MKRKSFLGAALTLALSSVMIVSASAADSSDSSYGYLAGQQKNGDRHAQYEQVAAFSTDADRSAFFAENDIGGGAYHDAQHLDADALVTAGIIDRTTADSIRQYATDKHTELSNRFNGMENLTPTERHELYAGFDKNRGDSVDALLEAGVITQEQAEAVNEYLAK